MIFCNRNEGGTAAAADYEDIDLFLYRFQDFQNRLLQPFSFPLPSTLHGTAAHIAAAAPQIVSAIDELTRVARMHAVGEHLSISSMFTSGLPA